MTLRVLHRASRRCSALARAWRAAALCLLGLLVVSGSAAAQEPSAFAISELNAGLPEAPQRLDRSTPRATLEALLDAARSDQWNDAAHLLDLDSVPRDEQGIRGPELARDLWRVVNRKLSLDFAGIPDRPDAMDTLGSTRDPMVGEARKSLSLGQLGLERYPVPIRINRVQTEGSAPVWVFSRQTVEHVPALFERYGPTALEQAMPQALRTEILFGLMGWELIALPIILALVAALGTAIWRILGRAARVSPNEAVALGVKRGRLPLVLFVMGLVLQAFITNVFVFSAPVEASLAALFWFLIILALVFGATRVLDTITDVTSNRYLETIDDPENTEARRWYTNLSAVKRVGTIVALVLGLALALSSLNIFSSFGMSLLISAGVATAIFGLAAQTVLGNILASLQLAFAKPIRIGDAVYYEDHWAYVEEINYTYVQLRTWDQKRFIVPVRHFVSTPFENWTKDDPELIKPILLTVDQRTDITKLREEFERIAPQEDEWTKGAEPKVQVIDQDEDGIKVRFYCTADDPTAGWDLHCSLREKMLDFIRTQEEDGAIPRQRIAPVPDGAGGEPLDFVVKESGAKGSRRRKGGPRDEDTKEAAE